LDEREYTLSDAGAQEAHLQALCFTLIVNTVLYWHTIDMAAAVE
jgi:hypothetical protein